MWGWVRFGLDFWVRASRGSRQGGGIVLNASSGRASSDERPSNRSIDRLVNRLMDICCSKLPNNCRFPLASSFVRSVVVPSNHNSTSIHQSSYSYTPTPHLHTTNSTSPTPYPPPTEISRHQSPSTPPRLRRCSCGQTPRTASSAWGPWARAPARRRPPVVGGCW